MAGTSKKKRRPEEEETGEERRAERERERVRRGWDTYASLLVCEYCVLLAVCIVMYVAVCVIQV